METYESVKSNPVQPEQKEKKKGGAWKGIVAVILAAGVVGSTTISAFNLVTLKSYIAEQKKEENPETTEDYVKIADNYEIKPTTNISDAYKSGDTSKLTDKEKETLDMAKKAIKDMKITDSMSDFEKEKAVYDWMTKKLQQDSGALTVIPSTQEDCDNPYGVLKYHNAVCVGYATTFRMFMQMMGIECKVEHNTEKFHSWDVVKIDGDWYITDIYSDAGNGNYANFNVTDAMYGQSQSWDRDYFPAANSLKYNMAYQNKKTVDSIYDLPKALRAAMDKKLGGVMVAFKEDITEEKAQVANAIASSIDNFLMSGNYKDMPYSLGTYNWIQDPDGKGYLFNVTMPGYNTDNTSQNISEKEQKKIDKAVQKAFQGLESANGDGMMMDGASADIGNKDMTMDNAGVCVYRDEKPAIFAPEGYAGGRIVYPAFFSSREVKEMGIDTTKIRSSRSTGILLAPSGIFVTYNSSSALMKWRYKSEMRVKALIWSVICQQRLSPQFRHEDVHGLILGNSMDLAYQILTSTGGRKHDFFMLDGSYEHFLYLTNDHQGEVILALLCDPGKTAELDRILLQGLTARQPGLAIEHDGISPDGSPVLFGYFCDLPRIARFNTSLELSERPGTLICFDFQAEVLRSYCGSRMRFQTIDFTKFEGRLFP